MAGFARCIFINNHLVHLLIIDIRAIIFNSYLLSRYCESEASNGVFLGDGNIS